MQRQEDKTGYSETSLEAQWLRLHAPNSGGPRLDLWAEN